MGSGRWGAFVVTDGVWVVARACDLCIIVVLRAYVSANLVGWGLRLSSCCVCVPGWGGGGARPGGGRASKR
eukprot:5634783-Prymnesium_polylepis.1